MNRNIKSTNQLGQANGAKCIVYGGAGAGKTRLAASAPAPLILSGEKGLLSLSGFNIPAWEINGVKDMGEAFSYIRGSAEARQFLTIYLDSCTEIMEKLYTELKRKHKDGRQLYPELQDKGAQMFRDFRDIPGKHVVLVCKMEEMKDIMGNVSYRPMFPGNKLSQQAPYFVDEVFYLYSFNNPQAMGGQRLWGLQTQPSNTHVAKDRSGKLAELENADPATGGGLTTIFRKMLT